MCTSISYCGVKRSAAPDCIFEVLLIYATVTVAEIPPVSSPTEVFFTVHHSQLVVVNTVQNSCSTKEYKA